MDEIELPHAPYVLIASAALGVIVGLIVVKLTKAAITIGAAVGGYLIGLTLFTLLNAALLKANWSWWNEPRHQEIFSFAVPVACALIIVVLAWYLFEKVLNVITSIIGSFLVVSVVCWFIEKFGQTTHLMLNIDNFFKSNIAHSKEGSQESFKKIREQMFDQTMSWETAVCLGAWIVLFIIGMTVQFELQCSKKICVKKEIPPKEEHLNQEIQFAV